MGTDAAAPRDDPVTPTPATTAFNRASSEGVHVGPRLSPRTSVVHNHSSPTRDSPGPCRRTVFDAMCADVANDASDQAPANNPPPSADP